MASHAQTLKGSEGIHRLPQLDSLRGLAALTVFCYHAFLMLPAGPTTLEYLRHTPLGFCVDGRAAVLLFFVLSGFVLTWGFSEARDRSRFWMLSFILRRIFRIYPAFLVSTLFAVALRTLVFDAERVYLNYAYGFAQEWKNSFLASDFARFLTLIWPGSHLDINPVTWSLVVEMRISLIFPIVIVLVNWTPRKVMYVLPLAAAYALGFLLPHVSTLRYFPHFVLGAICARHALAFITWLRPRPLPLRLLCVLGSLALYGTATHAPTFSTMSVHTQFLIEQSVGLGAAGLILSCLALSAPSGFFGSRPLRFLGATSYSFYLLHLVLMFSLSSWLLRFTASYIATVFAILVITYLISYVVFRFVEVPMNRVGRDWVRWAITQRFQNLSKPAGEQTTSGMAENAAFLKESRPLPLTTRFRQK
jgi:peptidoglycan/LPS O-acetylase OafA/YrhL